MKNTTKQVLGALAAVAVFLLVSLAADARPPGTLPLGLNLNGEATRPTQADGGGLLLYSTSSDPAWVTVNCGQIYKVVCPVTATNLCWNPGTGADAGRTCSNVTSSPIYGDPIAAGGFLYGIAQDCTNATTKVIAAISSTDAGVDCPVFLMR